METDYARKQLLELLREGKLGKDLAMEIAGLLASFFPNMDFTMGIYKDGAGLFYSTLPEDEAVFFSAVRKAGEAVSRPGPAFSQPIELFLGGGYGGFVVLEGERELVLVEAVRQFIEDCAFAAAFCLLAQKSEDNYQLDTLTGLPGRPRFQKTLEEIMEGGNEGYLLAACYDICHSHTGLWTSAEEENFCRLARRGQEIFGRAFRISDTVVAMLTENDDREMVFAGLQELSEETENIGAIYLPLSSLKPEHVYRQMHECMEQCTDGKVHGPMQMPARLPFWPADKRAGA